MATCIAPITRCFTTEESSAIFNLELDALAVEVIFQSNPERAYGFKATPAFAARLAEVMCSPDLMGLSLGRIISEARKTGGLEVI